MSIFRSERMQLCQLFLQAESAYNCIAELGEVGAAQFIDLNPDANPFQRKYINEVRRCDEMERQLRFLESEMQREQIKIVEHDDDPSAPPPGHMAQLEESIDKMEQDLIAINGNEETLRQNFLELTELKHILANTQTFFDERQDMQAVSHLAVENLHQHGGTPPGKTMTPHELEMAEIAKTQHSKLGAEMAKHQGGSSSMLAVPEPGGRGRVASINLTLDTEIGYEVENVLPDVQRAPLESDLSFVTGVIERKRLVGFERLLWRACRGNIFLRWAEIFEPLTDPHTREQVHKVVFCIFFQGDRLKTRVKKICEGFHAKVYPCPSTAPERRDVAIGVNTRISELNSVLNETVDHRRRSLTHLAQDLRIWARQVQKMKAIYHTLNMLNIDVTAKALIAECWVPVADMGKIRAAVSHGDQAGGAHVPSIVNIMETDETPPTFFRTNKFTRGYQNIVDSYGIADYTELNPTPWTVVTFPFLFGVMFGDVGHGMIMFMAGLTIVLMEKKLMKMDLGDIFEILFGGRYVVLMMGMFSMFCGLHYNEFYSKSFDIFGMAWHIPINSTKEGSQMYSMDFGNFTDMYTQNQKAPVFFTLDPETAQNHEKVYPIGMDPLWYLADNNLLFIDSFKMKLSVILGVTQMSFGVILSLFNHFHFNDRVKMICEFIPEVIFLSSIFVYMDVLIISKWLLFWVEPFWMNDWIGYYPGTNCAPSLLIGIIDMVMHTPKDQGFGTYKDNVTSATMSMYCNTTDNACIQQYFVPKPTNCALQQWYPHQSTIETVLVLAAIISIPWLLVPRPLILQAQAKKEVQQAANAKTTVTVTQHDNGAYVKDGYEKKNGADTRVDAAGSSSSSSRSSSLSEQPHKSGGGGGGGGHGGPGHGADFSLGDAFVYQAIHTIEFALGCVSHTASYLRLWALSLAHSQLSDVLWTMVLRIGFVIGAEQGINPILAGFIYWFIFIIFAQLTISILVLMEGLSAFLHSLRLHWVEFQSKFYIGAGYQFIPFNYHKQDGDEHGGE